MSGQFDVREGIAAAERFVAFAIVAAIIATVISFAPGLVRTARGAEIVTLQTAVNPIEVAPDFGARIVPVIAQLKAAGFAGIVKCYAARRGRHVANSAHFDGRACDLLPPPSGKRAHRRNRMPTVPLMFTAKAAAIIRAAGLRNGCSFHDCGHIDDRTSLASHRGKLPWPRSLPPHHSQRQSLLVPPLQFSAAP